MKNVRTVRRDGHAVSPVIATILMVAITVVLAAVLYVMVSGLLIHPEPPQSIGVSRQDTSANYVLRIDLLPAPHALSTTTFLMRDPVTSAVVNPPGQAALDTLIAAPVGGVQYLPVTSDATALEVSAVITISKTVYPTAGYDITIADGETILYSGTL